MARWAKPIALIAMLIAIIGAVTPDACQDTPLSSSETKSFSMVHSDRPLGCQNEEDCFCCAHFAPVQVFVPPVFLAFIEIDRPVLERSVLEVPLAAPYHPPKA
jgi:hypothetical protein